MAYRHPCTASPFARPDDWHLHLRDGAALAAVVCAHGARLRASNRHAKPAAAGHDGRRGRAPTAIASSRHCRRTSRFAPLMTLYLTDNTPPDGDRGGEGVRIRPRGQVLPGGRDDELGLGRDRRSSASYPVLAAMEKHGVVLSLHGEVTDARRRHVRSRARVRRHARWRAIVRDFPGAAHRARARHDARGGGSSSRRAARTSPRRSRRSICCGRATRCSSGGVRPHLYCLPILKRETPPRSAASRRRPRAIRKFFLGTDSRAACARHEGERVRLRRLLFGAARARAVRRSVRGRRRARPARRLRKPLRRRLLRPAAQRRHDHAGARAVDRSRRVSVRRRHGRAAARGRDAWRWRVDRNRNERVPSQRNLVTAVLSYESEASQTVAARAIGERKVRAPQSRMPGNARPQ